MSTSYYRLKPPVTSLRMVENGNHVKFSIWINHGLSGILAVPKTAAREMLDLFTLHQDDGQCPLRTHWGGKDVGAVVDVNDDTISDEKQVVSEYGKLLTVAEVKARAGAKRSDGMPTELFGYEKKEET